ncbi:MAG: hypothetical protein ACRD0O_10455 [Acidimicrobiia bacterium]
MNDAGLYGEVEMATDEMTTARVNRPHRRETEELTRHLWLAVARSYGQPVRVFP